MTNESIQKLAIEEIETKFQEDLAKARRASENPKEFEDQIRYIPPVELEKYRVETYFNMIHALREEHERIFLSVLRIIESHR